MKIVLYKNKNTIIFENINLLNIYFNNKENNHLIIIQQIKIKIDSDNVNSVQQLPWLKIRYFIKQ